MAFMKFDVRLFIIEQTRMISDVFFRHRQLFVRHVNADHPAFRADELRQQITVAPGAATEIKHGFPMQQRRDIR